MNDSSNYSLIESERMGWKKRRKRRQKKRNNPVEKG